MNTANVFNIFTGKPFHPSAFQYPTNARSTQQLSFMEDLKQKLEARFGDNQPLTGVIYNKPFSMKNNIRHVDAYGYGNVHNSKWQFRSRKNWSHPMPFPSNTDLIDSEFKKHYGKRFVLGHKSDAFMWMDSKYGITMRILESARKNYISLSIETMSDLIASDDYIEKLLELTNLVVVINMGSNESEEQERLDSPGAPSLKRRLLAAEKLKSNGITVQFRVKGERLDILPVLKGGAA